MTAFQLLVAIEQDMEKSAANPMQIMQRAAKLYAPRILRGVKGNGKPYTGLVEPGTVGAFRPGVNGALDEVNTMRREFRNLSTSAREAMGTLRNSPERNMMARDVRSLRNSKFRSSYPGDQDALNFVRPTARPPKVKQPSAPATGAAPGVIPAASTPVDQADAQKALIGWGMQPEPRISMVQRLRNWHGGLQPETRRALGEGAVFTGGAGFGIGADRLFNGGRKAQPQPAGAQNQVPNSQAYPTFYGGNVS